jgi:hypothetical protein
MIELSQVEAYFLRQPEVAAWPAMIECLAALCPEFALLAAA